jgi:hypothetical protein
MICQDLCTQILLPRLCGPDTVFLDVGAHIGSVIGEVRHVSRSIRIIAVEADPAKAASPHCLIGRHLLWNVQARTPCYSPGCPGRPGSWALLFVSKMKLFSPAARQEKNERRADSTHERRISEVGRLGQLEDGHQKLDDRVPRSRRVEPLRHRRFDPRR